MTKAILEITDAAAEKIKQLLAAHDKPAIGIKVVVKQGGCSGNTYSVEYADVKHQHDEIVTHQGVSVLIDPKSILSLIGTTMDYVDEKIKSGFVFKNPNEKGRCGCGESFNV